MTCSFYKLWDRLVASFPTIFWIFPPLFCFYVFSYILNIATTKHNHCAYDYRLLSFDVNSAMVILVATSCHEHRQFTFLLPMWQHYYLTAVWLSQFISSSNKKLQPVHTLTLAISRHTISFGSNYSWRQATYPWATSCGWIHPVSWWIIPYTRNRGHRLQATWGTVAQSTTSVVLFVSFGKYNHFFLWIWLNLFMKSLYLTGTPLKMPLGESEVCRRNTLPTKNLPMLYHP